MADHDHVHDHGHDHAHGEGSTVVALGIVSLGLSSFAVDREGQCEAGTPCTFGVEKVNHESAGVPTEAWVENELGEPLCEPVKGDGHDKHWHFKVMAATSGATKFVLRMDSETESISLCPGVAPRNGGIVTPVRPSGFLELKLHDDLGDLELWLYNSEQQPMDIAADTKISATFASHQGASIEFKPRNAELNEDEDGTPNMRNGKTNYFIFPGDTGADAEWLKGETWRGLVKFEFEVDQAAYDCDTFVLVPHSHL
mmetsp:Transcript_5006/g.18731  ORF Transcript_5006/g.18731 Transcript_5006/m.18731 type:complete len:255 (-) Transcript_5006:216-980(-)